MLATGSLLGPYEITAKLGEGGMGEVYRATDTKLKRDVAVKVLPEAFTQDHERLARFEREAQLLAQLHHPHIASIFGLEETGGVRALVMELVEGPTLADRMESGALPLEESLSIAHQIAEALEEAHDKGIIHRDLKPQNIKASIEGKVKVLDFGLAKAMDPAGASGVVSASQLAQSPTLTLGATVQGMILGTAAYMAPEQARGLAVDKRADLWAFGVVLYEMLSGRRLFEGELVTDVLANVINREIDLDVLPTETPPAIRRLLRRCLERKPKNRLHSIADARIVIDEVLSGTIEEPTVTRSVEAAAPRRPGWLAPAALVLVAVVGVATGWLLHRGGVDSTPDLEVALALPAGHSFALNNWPELTLSADGRRQVSTVYDQAGQSHLLLRDLHRAETTVLPDTGGAIGPTISPDGQAIAYVLGGTLRRQFLGGGPPVHIADVSTDYRGATWSSDGYLYFAPATATPIARVPENGGPVETVTALDLGRRERTHRWPHALPDGSAVLFTSDTVETTEYYDDARIEVVRPATGERKVLIEGSSQAWFLPPGHLLFARGGTISAVRFDPAKLSVLGEPVPLLQEVSTEVSSGAVRLAVAASGSASWVKGAAASQLRRVEWIEPDGSTTASGLSDDRYFQVLLSPDGKRAVISIVNESRLNAEPGADLWVVDLVSGRKSRLTFEGTPTDAVWTPDGSRIAFARTSPEGGMDIFWKPSDGSGEAERLMRLEGDEYPSSFTPDGRWLLLQHDAVGRADSDILRLDLETRQVEPLLAEPYEEAFGVVSPDGRWIAYASWESTVEPQILVKRYPELTGKWQISLRAGTEPHWSPEGDALYYRAGGTLYRAAVSARGGFSVDEPVALADGMLRGAAGNSYTVVRGGRVLRVNSLQADAPAEQMVFALDLGARARRLTASKR